MEREEVHPKLRIHPVKVETTSAVIDALHLP
jgi:hypothetical protein